MRQEPTLPVTFDYSFAATIKHNLVPPATLYLAVSRASARCRRDFAASQHTFFSAAQRDINVQDLHIAVTGV
jgi:hypothetical protein